MIKRPRNVLGIDLGSRYIKYVELRPKGKNSVIRSFGALETPAGTIDQTGILDPAAVSQTLKRLLQENKVQTSDTVVSIAGQASVVIRMMEVPYLAPEALREHMQWEIQKNSPFIDSSIVSDYYIMEPKKQGDAKRDALVAIAPLPIATMLQDLIAAAGKTLIAIDIEPLAIARSLQKSYGSRFVGQNVCVVDIGNFTTAINVYRDGQLLMPRQLPIGGSEFTRVIAENMHLSSHDAEEIKKEKAKILEQLIVYPLGESIGTVIPEVPFGTPEEHEEEPPSIFPDFSTLETPVQSQEETTPYVPYNPFAESEPTTEQHLEVPSFEETTINQEHEQMAATEPLIPGADSEVTLLFNAMQFALEEFEGEIRRSIDYLQTQGEKVDQMLLCGGGAQIEGLDKYLGTKLGVPCEMYDPFIGMNMQTKNIDLDFQKKYAPMFTVAVGNALYVQY